MASKRQSIKAVRSAMLCEKKSKRIFGVSIKLKKTKQGGLGKRARGGLNRTTGWRMMPTKKGHLTYWKKNKNIEGRRR